MSDLNDGAIARARVVSSYIASIGYDPARRTMAVEFHDGHLFHYEGVPPDVYDEFKAWPSIGAYFAHRIRGRFTSTRRTGDCGQCGDVGLLGCRCEDCGTGIYGAERAEPLEPGEPDARD